MAVGMDGKYLVDRISVTLESGVVPAVGVFRRVNRTIAHTHDVVSAAICDTLPHITQIYYIIIPIVRLFLCTKCPCLFAWV